MLTVFRHHNVFFGVCIVYYYFFLFPQDSLLHAIKEEYVEAVEILLEWEERIHQPGQPYVSTQTDINR